MGNKSGSAALLIIIVLAALFFLFLYRPSQQSPGVLGTSGVIIISYEAWNSYGNGSTINVTDPVHGFQSYVDGEGTVFNNVPFGASASMTLTNDLQVKPGWGGGYFLGFWSNNTRMFAFYWIEQRDGSRVAKVYGENESSSVPIGRVAFVACSNGVVTFTTDKYSSPVHVQAEANKTVNRMSVGGAYENPVVYVGGSVQVSYVVESVASSESVSWLQNFINEAKRYLGMG